MCDSQAVRSHAAIGIVFTYSFLMRSFSLGMCLNMCAQNTMNFAPWKLALTHRQSYIIIGQFFEMKEETDKSTIKTIQ